MTISERAASVGGVVLAGGSGSRLGADKASLDWEGTPLAERVARLLSRGLGGGPVVIVGPHGSGPPPTDFAATSDPLPDGGPLVGLSAGLDVLRGSVDGAVVVPCDLPLLHPAVVRALASRLLAGSDPVVAHLAPDGTRFPIPGAWRTDLADRLRAAITEGERGPRGFAEGVGWVGLDLAAEPEVAECDPDLDSMRDVDLPEDLDRLRSSPPKVRVARDGRLATIDAWTLGAAADATGGDPVGPCVLNGLPVEFDPRLPLARRDAVSLPPASG